MQGLIGADRVKSGSVIVRGSDVKQARKQLPRKHQGFRFQILNTNTNTYTNIYAPWYAKQIQIQRAAVISSEGRMSSKLANKPELPRKHQGLCFGHKYKVTFWAKQSKNKNCAIMRADKKQQGLRAPTSCYDQKWIQCLSFERVIHQGIKSSPYGETVEEWEPIRARSVMED